MFRWIIGIEPEISFPGDCRRGGDDGCGVEPSRDMPVDVFPEFAPPLVEIQTEGIGMSTAEVEELITIPMEELLKGTPEVDVVRSKSVMALSSIVLIFKRGTDILQARQLVQERLQLAGARLPVGIGPPVMLQPLSATSRVMKIGLSSKDMSLLDLSMTAYWKIRFRLLRVPGVANVPIWGERSEAAADPSRSGTDALTSGVARTKSWTAVGSPGFRAAVKYQFGEDADRRVHRDPESTARDHARLAGHHARRPGQGADRVAEDGKTVRLGDVAKVVWGEPLLIGDAVINDGPGLMLIVEKLPWANTLEVTRGVEAALAELRPGLPGIEIDSSDLPAGDVHRDLDP